MEQRITKQFKSVSAPSSTHVSYQNDPTRIYGMRFADRNIRFTVQDNTLTVCDIT